MSGSRAQPAWTSCNVSVKVGRGGFTAFDQTSQKKYTIGSIMDVSVGGDAMASPLYLWLPTLILLVAFVGWGLWMRRGQD